MGTWEIIKAAAVLGAFVYRTVKKHKKSKEATEAPPQKTAPHRGRKK